MKLLQIIFIFALSALPLSAAAVSDNTQIRRISESDLENRNLSLIIKEDFSKMTEGSETRHTNWSIEGTDDAYFNTRGWVCSDIHSAGGVCSVGAWDSGGMLVTPKDKYTGRYIIRFRAKAFGFKASLNIDIRRLLDNMYSLVSEESSATMIFETDGDWKNYVIEITSYFTEEASVLIHSYEMQRGVLLDDLEIYRDNDFVLQPKKPYADKFTCDGFTAGWTAVPGADSYQLSLFEINEIGTENITGSANFNSIRNFVTKLSPRDIPEGWDIYLTGDVQVTSNKGSGGSGALVMSAADEYIQLPFTGGTYQSFSCYIGPLGEKRLDGYCYIDVFEPLSNEWKVYGYINCNKLPYEANYGTIESIDNFKKIYQDSPDFNGLYTCVRIRVDNCSTPVLIDDIKFETGPVVERKTVAEHLSAAGTSYTFTGLDPKTEYYFSVKTVKGDLISHPTPLTHAFGVSRPIIAKATDIDRNEVGFTTNWEEIPNADLYRVDLYSIEVYPEYEPEATIFFEDFANVKSATGTIAQPEEIGNESGIIPLDPYVGKSGWEGSGNIIVDGMLGCAYDYGYYSTKLYSPYMSLQNNGGIYYVILSVTALPGDIFVVEGTDSMDAYSVVKTGLKTVSFKLANGSYHGRLVFYTLNHGPFLIDNVRVVQELKEGDWLYTKIGEAEETVNSHRFILDKNNTDFLAAYNVQAYHSAFGRTCESEMSDMAYVDLTSGIEDTESDTTPQSIRALPGAIEISLTESAEVGIYDISGRKVVAREITSGKNTIDITPGFYVVRAGNNSAKVLVK